MEERFFNPVAFPQDGEEGEEDTKFDPGYEPDWAVISTVKRDQQAAVKDSGAAGTRVGWSVLARLQDSQVCLLHRPVVLLPAPLGALLPAQGSLLLRPQLPGADQPRRPPAASAALPQGRNQGAPARSAALHHPGPVSPSSTDPPSNISRSLVPLGHIHVDIKPFLKSLKPVVK